uniref:Uncharacterized protein n=1 Tax=Ralstonia solanacearum TaxID=305 RepID=A0A0S4WCY9_RALSL|nr:protein of unknown function [Ralstonia solanacearum]
MFSTDAGWSSLAARRAHNPKVAGSNPAPATTKQSNGSLQDLSQQQAKPAQAGFLLFCACQAPLPQGREPGRLGDTLKHSICGCVHEILFQLRSAGRLPHSRRRQPPARRL